MKLESKIPERLHKEYQDLQLLGQGGQGLTFKARRTSNQEHVVLKVLDFLELSSWKNYELFLREIATLKTLDHPAIPKVLEVYPPNPEADEPEPVILILEYIEGKTLLDVLDSDGPWSTDDVRSLLVGLLGVLSYLHALNPPVIHRDIKPSNIIRRPDGSFVLVDFGAATATQKTNASTFVGTNGYMAPEQMMGRAEPRSDIYSLGATALHLLTGIHPVDLAREDLSLRLDGLGLDAGFARFLGRLVHPLPEKRFEDAEQVLRALGHNQGLVLREENEMGFQLLRQDEGTQIDIPKPRRQEKIVIGAFLSMIGPIPILTIYGAIVGGTPLWFILFFALVSFVCVYVVVVGVYLVLRKRRLYIDEQCVRCVEQIGSKTRVKTWSIDDGPDKIWRDLVFSPYGLGTASLATEQEFWLAEKLHKELEYYE